MEKLQTLIKNDIRTTYDENYTGENRLSGTYLHGKLEKDMEFDIFDFADPVEVDKKGGIYHFDIKGKHCVLFLWRPSDEERDFYDWRGYLVYRDDLQAFNYALEQFQKKPDLI